MKVQNFFKLNQQSYVFSDDNREKTINLDLNESLFGCDPRVLKAIRNVEASRIYSYPQTSDFEKRYAGILGISPQSVVATNGADSAIEVLMKSMAPDTRILTLYPTFGMYEICARWYSLEVEKIAYPKDFNFPLNEVINKMKSGKYALFLANPDSPTGGLIYPTYIEKLLESVYPSPVVIDETYYQFSGETAVPLLTKFDNLVILHSFSKAYGLAGLRIGALLANENIASYIRMWLKPFEVNQIALLAAMEALKYPEFVNDVVEQVNHLKKKLLVELRSMGLTAISTPANFILLKVGFWAEEIVKRLRRKGVRVKYLNYPPVMEGYIRMAIGPEEVMRDVLDKLKTISEELWRVSKSKYARH